MIRRLWVAAAVVLLVTVSAGAGAVFAANSIRKQIEVEYRGISMNVDGKPVATGDLEPFIYVEKGRTFIPARPLAEAMGGKVGWDEATGTVQIYTKTYVESKAEGDLRIWSMPYWGFSMKAPAGFVRQQIQTSLLQLAKPDPASGTNSVVAVSRTDPSPLPLKAMMEITLESVANTMLPEARVTKSEEAPDRITAWGTAKLFGQVPVQFSIRIMNAGGSTWMLLAMTAESNAAVMMPQLQQMVDSFAVQP